MNNVFDFIIDDEGDAFLLLYEREGEPLNPILSIKKETKEIYLYRNNEEKIDLSDVEEEMLEELSKQAKLSVCELSAEENNEEDEIEIAYNYTTDIVAK